MGTLKPYPPVKLIAAISINDTALWAEIRKQLQEWYSPIDLRTDWYEFHHTDYYTPEMGQDLKKRMVSFEKLIPAEDLPEIKLATNQLETGYAVGHKRRVNIDPGYLCAPKLVLATTKDYSHRLYLDKGIFGDIHLRYQKNHFQPQEWTYPDYREPFVLQFFDQVRQVYLAQLAGETF